MKAGEKTFQELLHGPEQYVIPVFQRYYTWKKSNWEQLWDDLLVISDATAETRKHFMGAIVCVPDQHQPGVVPAYLIIDGQQRLMTMSLLLCAMRDEAKQKGWSELAAEIGENYLVHRFKKDRDRYKVYPRLRDRGAYLALIDEKPRAGGSQVLAAYDYHADRLRQEGMDADEGKLRAFFAMITAKLDFVAITLDQENPYKIFKSLNSTGVDLEEGDLIRNHVFMALPVAEQDAFDDEHWRPLEGHFEVAGTLDGNAFAGFFRDVLMRSGGYIGRYGVYEAFEHQHPLPGVNAAEVTREFNRQAEHYDQIRGLRAHPDPRVDGALREIRGLQVSTSYPLVLALLAGAKAGTIDADGLLTALKAIVSFVLRRYICNQNSRQYGRWFCSACREAGDKPVAAVLSFLKAKGWPEDALFVPAFKRMNLYGRDYDKEVLATLELAIQAKSEPVGLDGCTIEHVLPQTIVESDEDGAKWIAALGPDWRKVRGEWQDTPGNLTLVGHDYNASMSNRAFAEKQPVLATSRVYLNRYFADPNLKAWNAEAIQARGQKLGEHAARVWAPPPA